MAIEVWTATDLNNVRNNRSGSYIQMADIDLSEIGDWEPIGDADKYWEWEDPFTGTYNGNNFTISNLTVNRPTQARNGLFGLAHEATFQNIKLFNIDIEGEYHSGAVCGSSWRTSYYRCFAIGAAALPIWTKKSQAWKDISACLVKKAGSWLPVRAIWVRKGGVWHPVMGAMVSAGKIKDHGNGAGGLVGRSSTCTFNQCAVNVDVELTGLNASGIHAGGMIGYCTEAKPAIGHIANCFAMGNVSAQGWGTGGFIGTTGATVSRPEITNCYSIGQVASPSANSGGFIGTVMNEVIVNNCYYDMQTSGYSDDDGRGEPRTTADMTYPENFANTFINWDFEEMWISDVGRLYEGYPYLSAI